MKTLYIGDNLPILQNMPSETVDLVYLDPPFNSGQIYRAKESTAAAGAFFKDNWKASDLNTEFQDIIYNQHPPMGMLIDVVAVIHGQGAKAYCQHIGVCLLELHRVLKRTGSLYLHCNPAMSHTLKLMLDAVFEKKNFLNEVIWSYHRFSRNGLKFASMHDVILLYVKCKGSHLFNKQETPRRDKSTDSRGYSVLVEGGVRKLLIYDEEKTRAAGINLAEFGENVWVINSNPSMGDTWTDISILGGAAKERTGYPTQKPLKLLRRIIAASSNPGQLVLDPFCGSGTCLVAAEELGRQWIGIDACKEARTVIDGRLKT